MDVLGHWRDSMLKMTDEPRWQIDGRTMRADGPWLKTNGRIEVVPAEQLRGAVEAGEALAQAMERHPFVDTSAGPSGAALKRWRELHPAGGQ